ncbi:hypothetical protein AM592_11660 [Bacillus gobiensis]|uniref:IrrE N-terminal-like domain-containing protein n=2 Tax=Bacillus TaxID=1386 RepID=A0A0M3RB24_9BACI|nr:hypothetical protein AM592_11660 [Bacillus gobiensis]
MSHLEEDVKNVYIELGILKPSEIQMHMIAEKLDIWIFHHDEPSRTKISGLYSIVLNSNLSPEEEWQDFSHELGHILMHYCNQHRMINLFRYLQENQADNFMYHFCVPTFMLLKYNITNYSNIKEGASFIAKEFSVTKKFAKKRLNLFRRKIEQAKIDEKFQDFMTPTKTRPHSEQDKKSMTFMKF